ncbi:ABC1 kinase family protein [Paeniglutamicibacter psychrophenolicus]|uniref:ABC1 kinase family protein n=1 Tax=Paeniglutamicibacter psychrophenolicus TaxID=257454 RepID=UPI0027827338|nr:AarF/ABC1/UbiB kinase family protein [Paeniglutamicibacter psychrophenolicus]MDQ0092406.1 ubiquinone biosynthesis protein [Paeniglutamicibacter psychrophenolicus]
MTSHFERYAEVAEILVRHGFESLVNVLGLERLQLRSIPRASGPLSNPDRLVLALEELGPAFIKLGQVLSTRPDLLPPNYLAALSRLQDGTLPVPSNIIRSLITQELGASPEEVFADFSDAPLASASIGQAHAATLHNGTAVVVKVRRPGVVSQVQEDLEILQNLAHQASRNWSAVADYNVESIAAAFAATLRAELDYLKEGQNAERFANNFAGDASIHIPKVFWETTTSRVLTIERIHGLKIDDAKIRAMPVAARDQLAEQATRAIAQMIFDDGFFHADPHPGNLFVESTGCIGLIDFGMVGELSERLRDQLGKLLLAFSRNDADRISRCLIQLSINTNTTNRERLVQDIGHFMRQYQGKLLGEVQLSSLVTELLAILRTHRLQLPSEMAMLAKMILMTEGMGVRLNPEFNLGEVLKPYAGRLALERLNPRRLPGMLKQWGLDAADLGADLPELLERVLRNLDDGPEVRLRSDDLLPLLARAERIGNRLVAGMILAAFIRGIGDLTTADRDRLNSWQNWLLAGGLGAMGAMGGYLAWTSRPKARRPGP